jgi:hypothetical protein
MEADIIASESFRRAWEELTPQMRGIVTAKIRLLVVNPGHPSLQVHKLRRAKGIISGSAISRTLCAWCLESEKASYVCGN